MMSLLVIAFLIALLFLPLWFAIAVAIISTIWICLILINFNGGLISGIILTIFWVVWFAIRWFVQHLVFVM